MRTISGINKTLAMLLILLASTLTFAQSSGATTSEGDEIFNSTESNMMGDFHHRHHGGRMRAYLAEQLGLTDAQKSQIKQIHQNHKETIKPLVQELRAKRQDLHKSFNADNYDEALATQKFSEMASLKAKLMGEKLKVRKEMLSVLTPEQKAKFEQLKEQFKNRRAERMRFRNS